MNPTLPPELWLHIHALATEKSSALALSHSECQRFAPRHQDFSKPFNLITQFYQDVHAFTRVCRLWNALATALLYENVVVNEHFPALHKTLEERPNLKHAVRAVRLSPYRLDDNNAILLACPNISVVCQADDSEKSYGHYRAASFDLQRPQIPQTLPSLQILYWVETDQSTGLLQPILQAAPNLKRLFISESPQPATKRVASDLSTVATRLEQLSLGQLVGWDMTRWILALDFSRLTSLECAPGFIEHADFPATLPRLQMLRLSCFRSRIPFARIFARFPALRDLSYGVWDSFVPLPRPSAKASHNYDYGVCSAPRQDLLLVRLTSAISFRVIKDWKPIHDHFTLLLDPAFPPTARVVLYGAWDWIMTEARFAPMRAALREKGCLLEHPEGKVVN